MDKTNQANTTPGELKRKFIDDDQDDASYKRAMTVNPRSRFYGVPQNSLLTAVLTRENYAEQPEPVKEKKARKSNVRSKKVSTKTVATASVRCSARFTNNANSHTAGEIAA